MAAGTDYDFKALVEQVRQASDIVEIIGSYVPLKPAAGRFKGLSPFNKEKTPSFMVDPGKQLFHCFSSNQGGDVFNFLMLYENLDFMGALRRLGERAGIEIPERTGRGGGGPGGPSNRTLREELLRLHEAVAAWWAEQLHKAPAAEAARAYLRDREMGSALARQFQIGYAPPEWDGTLSWARKKGFSLEVLEQSGLIVAPEDNPGRRYDRFRGRLMFPICSEVGKVVAFSGRILDPDAKAAKYVNSPETPIFMKSKILFGLDKTKREIRDQGFALLCEGQIDLIRCVERGFGNAVAPQGTAFTEHHARLLKRFTEKAVICFDADRAGEKAAFGSAEKLLEEGFEVRIAAMPAGEDPDSLLRRPEGPGILKERIAQARDYARHVLETACRAEDVTSPRGRGRVAETMAAVVAKVPNAIHRERLALEVATRLEVPLPAFQRELEKAGNKAKTPPQPFADAEAAPAADLPFLADGKVATLASLCLHHPELVPTLQRQLHPEWLSPSREDASSSSSSPSTASRRGKTKTPS